MPDTTCSFSDCSRKFYAKGLCKGHYQQQLDGKSLRPLRGRRSIQEVSSRNASGNKHCIRCDEWLPEGCFGKKQGHADGLYMWCRRCQADERKGLTLTQRSYFLTLQGGRCAGCGFTFDIHGGKKETYRVDHDHSCCPGNTGNCGKCIRGLLCNSCNKQDVLAIAV